jgi:putative monooxygenase ydhR
MPASATIAWFPGCRLRGGALASGLMHALFVSYRLESVSPAQHADLCSQLGPAFAAVPGLVSATWLQNTATMSGFGAFYVFESRPAFEGFVASELYAATHEHVDIRDLIASEFAVEASAVGNAQSLQEVQ